MITNDSRDAKTAEPSACPAVELAERGEQPMLMGIEREVADVRLDAGDRLIIQPERYGAWKIESIVRAPTVVSFTSVVSRDGVRVITLPEAGAYAAAHGQSDRLRIVSGGGPTMERQAILRDCNGETLATLAAGAAVDIWVVEVDGSFVWMIGDREVRA
jgi:hypothetical protein